MKLQPLIAELIGTFALVFFGSMSVSIFSGAGALGILPIALAHGLALMIMVYSVGRISGAYVNPAVTIAMLSLKKIGFTTAILYIVFQLIGASLAGFAHSQILTSASSSFYGLPQPTDMIGKSQFYAVIIEAILTFFLAFTILNASSEISGFAIGMTLAAGILIGGTLTGAALNPARAFGPAIISGNFATQWVYWLGPIAGALIAGVIYKFLSANETTASK